MVKGVRLCIARHACRIRQGLTPKSVKINIDYVSTLVKKTSVTVLQTEGNFIILHRKHRKHR